MEFDQHQPGEYERRLGKLNQTNKVIANAPILNEAGAVVVGQDCTINPDVVKKIQKHRLIKPLEEQVSLDTLLMPKELYMAFDKMIKADEEYAKLETASGSMEMVKEICKLYGNYPILIQKLTVLSADRSDYFHKSLFCCWLAVIIGRQMKLSNLEIKHLGLAALFQDLGILYISDEMIDSLKPDLDIQKIYENHALLSHACLKLVPDLPESIAIAALEHHEEPDGLGYPKCKMEKDISLHGQILIVINQIFDSLYCDNKLYSSLGSLIPILKLYGSLYHRDIYYALMFVFRKAKFDSRKQIKDKEDLRVLMSQLLINHTLLSTGMREVVKTLDFLQDLNDMPQVASLQSVGKAIWTTDSSTGLLAEGLVRWMSHVEEHLILDAVEEMQDIYVLQQVFRYQLIRFREALARSIEKLSNINMPICEELKKALSRLGQYDGHFNRRVIRTAQAA